MIAHPFKSSLPVGAESQRGLIDGGQQLIDSEDATVLNSIQEVKGCST